MEIFSYIWFAFYGLVAGVIAKTLMPGKDGGGLILTVGLGICGSMVGGFVFSILGYEALKGFSLRGLVPAVLGAFLILFFYKKLSKRFK